MHPNRVIVFSQIQFPKDTPFNLSEGVAMYQPRGTVAVTAEEGTGAYQVSAGERVYVIGNVVHIPA